MSATAAPRPEPLWTVKELAAYLQRSERWLLQHREELPTPIRLPGGGLRWEPEQVRAWARGQRVGEQVLAFPPRRPK